MTKQGVRDLDVIYGKVKPGKVLEIPKNQLCNHKKTKRNSIGDTICLQCGTVWDYSGNEY